MRSGSDIKHHASLLRDWFHLVNTCFFQWISLPTRLTSCFSITARAPDKRIVDTRGRCVAFGDGFNNKSFDRDEVWAAPRSQSSRVKVRPHLFSFLMALFPTEDSPPGPTTMAPGPQNLLTAQLGPKVEIRHLWRVERRLSGPPRA